MLLKRKTKIIATVGPASEQPEKLLDLVEAGVNVFRLNFSHGSHENHKKIINRILSLNRKYKKNISIIADLQGPKLRIGNLEQDQINLIENEKIEVVTYPVLGNSTKISVTYENLAIDVKKGEQILIDDGKLVLEVLSTNKKDSIICTIKHGGILSPKKGFNLPLTNTTMPSLTEKDRRDLDFILQFPINWIALSFVRNAKEILELKEIIRDKNSQAKVIAKIEKPEAVKNIDNIIKASDAIMIARGDLGVEVAMEEMPLIQKSIIKKCIKQAKPVIVATQVMETMIEMPMPTRAEITDVANAVIDGTDAVMLSGETSVGKFPVKVIETINKIVLRTEREPTLFVKNIEADLNSPSFASDVICQHACRIADDVKANAIVGMTHSGYTGFMLSSFRPKAIIYIFTHNKHLLNTLSLAWGVECHYYDKFVSTDQTIQDIIKILKTKGNVATGDIVINTASMPIKGKGRANMVKLSFVH
jgi:pyruvate kinase